jgi:hypothetical protein
LKLRSIVAAVTVVALLASPLGAQWDKSKPPTGPNSPLVSADIRNNWAALETALAGVNLLADPTHLLWPLGDSTTTSGAINGHWGLSYAGGTTTWSRTGTGLGDTTRKVGDYASKLAVGTNVAAIYQFILKNNGDYDDGFDGVSVSYGAWVKCSVGSAGRLKIADGVGSPTASAYHTGGGAWEWLTVTRAISSGALSINPSFEVAANQTCYVSGHTAVLGTVPPAGFRPAPVVVGHERVTLTGAQTTGTNKVGTRIYWDRPTLVRAVQIALQTTNTGAAFIVDVNHWDGAAFTSMFSTRPTIADGGFLSAPTPPDGTYRYRCFNAVITAGSITDAGSSIDVDQVGSTVAGTDLYVYVSYLQWARPLESFLQHISTGQ